MRGLVHLIAAIAVAAVAVAFGRWLRDPVPGGALLALLAAAIVCAVALRHLYRPGGVGRAAPRGAAEAEPLPTIASISTRRARRTRSRGGRAVDGSAHERQRRLARGGFEVP